jgi:Domain of unknown function (DUF4189)
LPVISGEGAFVSLSCARLVAAVVPSLLIAAFAAPANAAGALSVGKCGAYGHAFDFRNARAAIDAAQKQCKGDCKTIPMRRACAALSVDMVNPCGAHGYAVAPRISSAQNSAIRSCYKFGGKECVIRTWACDARG